LSDAGFSTNRCVKPGLMRSIAALLAAIAVPDFDLPRRGEGPDLHATRNTVYPIQFIWWWDSTGLKICGGEGELRKSIKPSASGALCASSTSVCQWRYSPDLTKDDVGDPTDGAARSLDQVDGPIDLFADGATMESQHLTVCRSVFR
jgi:hypothetical protein